MPLKFWDEAFLAATYLINRTPSKVINLETPLEKLFHETPNYHALRTFGCACWPNLRPFNARKLEFRSKQCVFLGYSNLHKGFKCLDITARRVYISRDVVFDETVFPFAKLNPKAGASIRSEVLLLSENPSSLPLDHGDEHIANDHLGNSHENSAINFGGNSVVHYDFMQQQRTSAEHEEDSGAAPGADSGDPGVDPPSPAAPGSGSAPASGSAGPPAADHASPRGPSGHDKPRRAQRRRWANRTHAQGEAALRVIWWSSPSGPTSNWLWLRGNQPRIRCWIVCRAGSRRIFCAAALCCRFCVAENQITAWNFEAQGSDGWHGQV